MRKLALGTMLLGLAVVQVAHGVEADLEKDWAALEQILASVKGVADKPIANIQTTKYTAGMLMGNGDIGVVAGDTATSQKFYFGQSGFWGTHWNPGHNYFDNSILSLGGITISSPLKSVTPEAAFHMEQDILHAQVHTTMNIGGAIVTMNSWTADSDNLFVTELSTPADAAPVTINVELWMPGPNPRTTYPATAGIDQANNLLTTSRQNNMKGANEYQARAGIALKILGANIENSVRTPNATTASITLQPGKPIQLVAVLRTDAREGDRGPTVDALKQDAVARANAITANDIPRLSAEHRDWWKNYWLRSFVQIDDQLINEFYYGSLYVMGCATRWEGPDKMKNGRFYPPSLWGNFIVNDDAAWGGRYFLNYNAEAPFYGVFSSNRPELVLPYAHCIIHETPFQQARTAGAGYQGVCFQRSLAPFHLAQNPPAPSPVAKEKHQERLQDQKSDGAFAIIPAIWYWEYTRDETFLKDKLYPALKQLDAFHRDMLTWDESKKCWVMEHSAAHEEPQAWDVNPNLDLGFYRKCAQTLLAAREVLNTDADLRPKWQHLLDHISAYPIGTEQGKEVFLMAEKRGNPRGRLFAPGDQPINMEGGVFPGEQIAIGGDPHHLQTALNSLELMNSWGVTKGGNSNNGFCKEFIIAARVGWPADDLLEKLKASIKYLWRPTNLTPFQGGGGIETAGSIEAINSMLLQSEFGVIRVFPNWSKTKPAAFKRLRAKNAFIVSGSIERGAIAPFEITSEKGLDCSFANPWPNSKPLISGLGAMAGKPSPVAFTQKDGVVTFHTSPGAQYRISPTN